MLLSSYFLQSSWEMSGGLHSEILRSRSMTYTIASQYKRAGGVNQSTIAYCRGVAWREQFFACLTPDGGITRRQDRITDWNRALSSNFLDDFFQIVRLCLHRLAPSSEVPGFSVETVVCQ